MFRTLFEHWDITIITIYICVCIYIYIYINKGSKHKNTAVLSTWNALCCIITVIVFFQVWISSIRWECSPWARGPRLHSQWEHQAIRSVMNTPCITCFFISKQFKLGDNYTNHSNCSAEFFFKETYLCPFTYVDRTGWIQDGTTQCQSDTEPVSAAGAVPWLRTRCWYSSARYCPARHTGRHATGKVAQSY